MTDKKDDQVIYDSPPCQNWHSKPTINEHLILINVGIFAISQRKSPKTSKWQEPVVRHGSDGVYKMDGLIKHEKNIATAKNIYRVLALHYKKQGTPEAYSLTVLGDMIQTILEGSKPTGEAVGREAEK